MLHNDDHEEMLKVHYYICYYTGVDESSQIVPVSITLSPFFSLGGDIPANLSDIMYCSEAYTSGRSQASTFHCAVIGILRSQGLCNEDFHIQ
jgi:hypothetical protein